MMNDAGRGYRRVVPSPKPIMILELEAIEILLKAGFCVIAAGGGGIPVIKTKDNQWVGIDAVIDKDFATSLLANQLNADLLVISTGIEKVYINLENRIRKDLIKSQLVKLKNILKKAISLPAVCFLKFRQP